MNARTWVILPVKSFEQAKSRLKAELAPPKRSAFAEACFEHVLGLCLAQAGLAGTLVASNSRSIQRRAEQLGALALEDPPLFPQNKTPRLAQIVDHAIAHITNKNATQCLVLMADLPHLSAQSLTRALTRLQNSPIIVPDHHRVATNALGLHLPISASTAFGSGSSYELHRERFPAVQILEEPHIQFDVDEPVDLARFQSTSLQHFK